MGACDPDSSVEICSSAADPVFVSPIAGGAGGLTDAELRATPVKVDDDATQALLTLIEDGISVALAASAIYRNLDIDESGASQIAKASAGRLIWYFIYNNASSVRFVKVYDKATAADETDTPVLTLAIPAASAANVTIPGGLTFAAGIALRATTGVADNDTGAPGANDVIVNLGTQ